MERDEAAFTAFVQERKDSLVNYLTHMLRSRDRAEEIAQDAFVRFYRSGWQTRTDEQLVPYLFRIATNLSISLIRRERRWQRLLPFLIAREPRSAPAADREMISDEIQQQVALALERLPVKFRAPLVLFEIEEWPYEQIARALETRIGTIKSRISRARGLMRKELQSWWIGGNDDGQRSWRRVAATAANDDIASIRI
jgi:RNA polymerase sigma-70 factor (ECF subfamily)